MSACILVIEDNEANLDLMTYLLSAFGYRPITAQDGAEGVQIAEREAPDLILCDVQLPTMDGYEVVRWLKSHPHLQTIPLVAVTAMAMVGDRDKMLAAGFDGYITKPIAPETFVGEVAAFLQEQRSVAPLPTVSGAVQSVVSPSKMATILVVDNMPVNLELTRRTFTPFGYDVITAQSMAEALVLARRTVPDLILSDVNMAEGSGYDFITAVKADPCLRAIPFVFITSTALHSLDRAMGLRLGAVRFLVRPLEPHALMAEIEACLRERKTGETWQPS